MKELNIFKRQITKEKQEVERVMKEESIVDEHVVAALNHAGAVSKEALKIKAEMDQFYAQNIEWMVDENRQIDDRDEILVGKDEKVKAQIAAARKRFDDYKEQLRFAVIKLVRRKSLVVRQRESGWMVVVGK